MTDLPLAELIAELERLKAKSESGGIQEDSAYRNALRGSALRLFSAARASLSAQSVKPLPDAPGWCDKPNAHGLWIHRVDGAGVAAYRIDAENWERIERHLPFAVGERWYGPITPEPSK